jgi:excisionase family DNA binding protein
MTSEKERRTTEVGSLWEPLRTPKEAAEFLRVHEKTAIRYAREKRIPAIRLGGKLWRFRSSDLTAWAASQVQSARQPFE